MACQRIGDQRIEGQAPLLGALVLFVPGDASMDPVKNPLKDPTAKK